MVTACTQNNMSLKCGGGGASAPPASPLAHLVRSELIDQVMHVDEENTKI